MSFAKNLDKNIAKNIIKRLSGNYGKKLLDHASKSARDALQASSKRLIQDTAKAIGYLIGNKIADKIIKVSIASPQNNPETITNEHEKEIPRE